MFHSIECFMMIMMLAIDNYIYAFEIPGLLPQENTSKKLVLVSAWSDCRRSTRLSERMLSKI